MCNSIRSTAVTLASIMLLGCVEQAKVQPAADGITSIKLALNWYPEVEHGGFIAAETLGLYDAEKLNLELVPGGPGAPQLVITELAAERILFAVSDADNVVKARAAGLPIVRGVGSVTELATMYHGASDSWLQNPGRSGQHRTGDQ
jgi:NitT/TauT family transport system substrate-binding protein